MAVEPGSLADLAHIKEGDYLVGVQERDTKWFSHSAVVALISQAETYLRLTVVTPVKPWAKYKHSYTDQSSTTSASSSSSTSSSASSSNIIRVFTPSSSRTSFSSMSSTSSKES